MTSGPAGDIRQQAEFERCQVLAFFAAGFAAFFTAGFLATAFLACETEGGARGGQKFGEIMR